MIRRLTRSLSGRERRVACHQPALRSRAAGTLPTFLLAIPAGILSDILDRRRFLIAVQLLLAAVSGALMVLSSLGWMTVTALVALAFVGGIGAALTGPTWQIIVPELVPPKEMKGAVALNSFGICWR